MKKINRPYSLSNLLAAACALSAVIAGSHAIAQSCSTELRMMKQRAATCEAKNAQGANLEANVNGYRASLAELESLSKARIADLEKQIAASEKQLTEEKQQNEKLRVEFASLSEARSKQVAIAPDASAQPAQRIAPPAAPVRPATPPPAPAPVTIAPTSPPPTSGGRITQQAGPVTMTLEGCVAEANYYAICTFDFASLSGDPKTVMKFKYAALTDLSGKQYMLESVKFNKYNVNNNIDNNSTMYYTIKQARPFKAVMKFRNVPGSINGISSIKYVMRVNRFDYPVEFSNLPISQ